MFVSYWDAYIKPINLANKLTLCRVALMPLFVVLLVVDHWASRALALVVFLGAAITDYYDGKIARERKIITNFGRLMDPLADKVLVCAGFIYFAQYWPYLPFWCITIIVVRELLVSGLRLLAISYGRAVTSSALGKYKTFSQMAMIVALLLLSLFREFLMSQPPIWTGWLEPWVNSIIFMALCGVMALTIYSGYDYFYKNKDLLSERLNASTG